MLRRGKERQTTLRSKLTERSVAHMDDGEGFCGGKKEDVALPKGWLAACQSLTFRVCLYHTLSERQTQTFIILHSALLLPHYPVLPAPPALLLCAARKGFFWCGSADSNHESCPVSAVVLSLSALLRLFWASLVLLQPR